MQLLDTKFGRSDFPKTVNYWESDFPNRWKHQWKKRNAHKTKYFDREIIRTDIEYKINSQGYREKEWNQINWNDCYIFLGCSHTVGVGVPYNKTIPKLMEKKLSSYCVNLGISGGCNYFSMCNSSYLIENNIKPKGIFFQRTYKSRWFDFKENWLRPLTANDKEFGNFYQNGAYINFIDDTVSQTITSLWKDICPVIEYQIDDLIPNNGNERYIARDGCHYNGDYFEKVAKILYDKYIKNTKEPT